MGFILQSSPPQSLVQGLANSTVVLYSETILLSQHATTLFPQLGYVLKLQIIIGENLTDLKWFEPKTN